MRTLNITAIAVLGAMLFLSGKPAPEPKAEAAPIVVGSPPGELAQLRTELKSANDKIGSLTARLSQATDDLRAARMERDKLLVKQSQPVSVPYKFVPQVRQPVKPAPPAAVRLPAAGGGGCSGGVCRPQYQRRAILPWRR